MYYVKRKSSERSSVLRIIPRLRYIGLLAVLAWMLASGPAVLANGVGTIFVADEESGTVTVLDGVQHLAVERIRVGNGPHAVVFSLDFQRVYVLNKGGANIAIIDRQSYAVVAGIPLGGEPDSILFDPEGLVAYVTNAETNEIMIINVAESRVDGTIPDGRRARAGSPTRLMGAFLPWQTPATTT